MPAVKMYTTQVCPYCQRAKALLKQRGVEQIEEARRVAERTAELTRVNEALSDANLAKTRFLAAASHDPVEDRRFGHVASSCVMAT